MVQYDTSICSVKGMNKMRVEKITLSKEVSDKILLTKEVCMGKLGLVKQYLLDVKDDRLRLENERLTKEMLMVNEDLFTQILNNINYLKEIDLVDVLDSIVERFELVDLINENNEDRCEEYFEVLLDLPITVTQILKLDKIKDIMENLQGLSNSEIRLEQKCIGGNKSIITSIFGQQNLYKHTTNDIKNQYDKASGYALVS